MTVRITPGAAESVAAELKRAEKAVTLAEGPTRGSVVVTEGKNSVVVNNRGNVTQVA